MKQSSLKNYINITGQGLHKNKINSIIIEPAPENNGISLMNKKISLNALQSSKYQIGIKTNIQIYTTEHLLSSLYSLGITNCNIIINQGNEVPILDGSAYKLIKLILGNGIIKQKTAANIKKIPLAVCLKLKDKYIIALEGNEDNTLKINARISFPKYKINETYSLTLSKENFINNIAKARTFGFIEDWNKLKKQGYALGANYNNCLVFSKTKLLNPPLRYPNECVRHKILDFIGSLALNNYRLLGQFYLYKSGHHLDTLFIKILDQIISKQTIDEKYKENIILDRNEIESLIAKDFTHKP